MKKFTAYCKDYFKGAICEFEGKKMHMYELPYEMRKAHEKDGKNLDFKACVKAWYDDCEDFYNYELIHYGYAQNPMQRDMRYIHSMVFVGLLRIIELCGFKEKAMLDEVIITDDFIGSLLWKMDDISDSYRLCLA